MLEVQPPIRYTTVRGATLAYQVLGDGPVDLIVVPGQLSHLEASWDEPAIARFNRRLAAVARLIPSTTFPARGSSPCPAPTPCTGAEVRASSSTPSRSSRPDGVPRRSVCS